MQKTTPVLIGAIVIFVILIGAGVYAYTANKAPVEQLPGNSTGTPSGNSAAPAAIKFFGVQAPNFVIKGDNLSKVDVYAVVGRREQLVGSAVMQQAAAQAGMGDTWTLALPRTRLNATSIFARGYDKAGSAAARIDLDSASAKNL